MIGHSGTPFFRCVLGAIFAFLALLLISCGTQSTNTVARSDLGPVSRADLDQYILSLDEASRSPSQGQDPSLWRQNMLEKLLLEKALLAEIESSELELDPSLEEQIRRVALVSAFEEQFIDPETVIDEEDLRQYYDTHPDEFGHPEQIRLRHIFKRVPRGANGSEKARVRAEMEEMLGRIRKGAHFGDLARENSDSETAPLNGLIGRLSRGALDPSLEKIVWNLEEGQVSEVVPTPVGFHIFFLEDRLEPFHMDFEEARGRLWRKLQAEARQLVIAETMTELLEESGADYYPEKVGSTEPHVVLFAIENAEISVATLQEYAGRVPFYQLRQVPPLEWLNAVVRNRIFLWKAEQLALEESPEIQESIQGAVTRTRLTQAYSSKVRERVGVLDAEGRVEEYWDQNFRRFQSPKLYHLHMVLKSFDDLERNYDAFEMLENARAEILSGSSEFSDVATAISDDLSAGTGGDLGWVRLDSFGKWAGPRANTAVRSLQPGEISEPVLVEYYDETVLKYRRKGYVLIMLEETREPEVLPYDEVRFRVREAFAAHNQQEMESEINREILDSINAEILGDHL